MQILSANEESKITWQPLKLVRLTWQSLLVFQCDTSTFIYTNKFNQYFESGCNTDEIYTIEGRQKESHGWDHIKTMENTDFD